MLALLFLAALLFGLGLVALAAALESLRLGVRERAWLLLKPAVFFLAAGLLCLLWAGVRVARD